MRKIILAILMVVISFTTVFADVKHTDITLEAEKRGVEYIDGWLCWSDTKEEVQPNKDGWLPYEEFYFLETPEITREEIGMVADAEMGKKLHDKYCNANHNKKSIKKIKKIKKHCKKHKKNNKKCKKCKKKNK